MTRIYGEDERGRYYINQRERGRNPFACLIALILAVPLTVVVVLFPPAIVPIIIGLLIWLALR